MASYGYAPPPPPPPSSSSPHTGRGNSAHGRGPGPSGRGRGGANYRPQQNSYPQQHQAAAPAAGHYDYSAHQAYHHPTAYAGAQHHQAGSYAPQPAQPQWSPDQHAQAAAYQQQQHHPGYQAYAHHPQAQQHQGYQAPQHQQPQHYGYQPPPPPPDSSAQQWSAQNPHPPPGSFSGSQAGAGRGRSGGGGGGYADRGRGRGGAHVQSYDHSQYPQVSGSYAQPYGHDAHTASYPPAPYHYSAPPPPPTGRHDGYQGHNQRGRGGGPRGRGRGGHNFGDRPRHHNKGQGDHQGQHGNKAQQPQQQQKNKHKQQDQQPAGKKKKRKTANSLGLTPAVDSETEDDEEEETTLATLLGPETFVPDDIAAYIAQRKRNFPTKARVEAKKLEAKTMKKEDPNSNASAGKDKTSELEKQADKLRRQLRKVEFSIKRKREQGDEGDEMRDSDASSSEDDDDDGAPEVMSSRSAGAANLPKPPTAGTKAAQAQASSSGKADISRHCKYYSTGGTCGKKSKCRFVHDPEVREAAIKEREANQGRLTIQQRLILNDKEQEDLAVLESIQYLRNKGVMHESKKAATKTEEDVDSIKQEDNVKQENAAVKQEGNGIKPATPTPSPKAIKTGLDSLPAKPPPTIPPPSVSSTSSPASSSLPRRSGSHKAQAQAEATTDGENQQQQQSFGSGWLAQPYGGSGGADTKSDDLP